MAALVNQYPQGFDPAQAPAFPAGCGHQSVNRARKRFQRVLADLGPYLAARLNGLADCGKQGLEPGFVAPTGFHYRYANLV